MRRSIYRLAIAAAILGIAAVPSARSAALSSAARIDAVSFIDVAIAVPQQYVPTLPAGATPLIGSTQERERFDQPTEAHGDVRREKAHPQGGWLPVPTSSSFLPVKSGPPIICNSRALRAPRSPNPRAASLATANGRAPGVRVVSIATLRTDAKHEERATRASFVSFNQSSQEAT